MTFAKYILLGLGIMFAFLPAQMAHTAQNMPIPPQLPVKGMVTMIDLGATECIPCKMMAPIMKEVEAEYRGRAAIVFIDVWKNKGMDKKFGIRTIPTQIFYDHTGKEVFRHEGFLDKSNIIKALAKLGVPLNAGIKPGSAPPASPPAAPQQPAMPPQAQRTVVPRVPVPQVNVPQPGMPPAGPAGVPTGLLTPGVANLLYMDINVSQPKEEAWKVFTEIEKEYKGKITLFVLDANTNQDMVRNLGVRSVPTLIIYDPEGREAMRYPGMPNLQAIQNVLAKIVKK